MIGVVGESIWKCVGFLAILHLGQKHFENIFSWNITFRVTSGQNTFSWNITLGEMSFGQMFLFPMSQAKKYSGQKRLWPKCETFKFPIYDVLSKIVNKKCISFYKMIWVAKFLQLLIKFLSTKIIQKTKSVFKMTWIFQKGCNREYTTMDTNIAMYNLYSMIFNNTLRTSKFIWEFYLQTFIILPVLFFGVKSHLKLTFIWPNSCFLIFFQKISLFQHFL